MKLTGKDGVLRIYDGSKIIHNVAPLSHTIDIVTWDGASTWINVTTECSADDTSYANDFLPDNTAMVFIGSTSKFALAQFLKGGGANYAAGSGALKGYYFNGSNFSTALSGLVDGTASGGDCFAADGNISFQIPRDWALGANSYNANLDADKYYIALMTTTSSTTDVDADILAPLGAQYFDTVFSKMDFSGPIGRPLCAEQLVFNRGRADAYMHYVKGPDDVIYQPIGISFGNLMDNTYNKTQLKAALQCGNPNSSYWTSTGTTTKGTTKNDGTNYNPAFIDTSKKTVNIQTFWEAGGYGIGDAYYECYFDLSETEESESGEEVVRNILGGCYGVIETIYGLGVRY